MQNKIGLEIRFLSKYISRYLHGLQDMNESISGPQGLILIYLCHSEKNVYQRDIEKFLNIRRSTATGLITTLEKNGYLVKESVESDARLKKLVPTSKANDAVCLIEEQVIKLEEKMLKGINQKEIENFRMTMSKMTNNLLEDAENG